MPKQKFCQKQLIKADLRGFNAKIGSITNNSSCMFAMLPLFKGDQERENIIKERIRILRKLIGNSIDAAKGVEYIPFPVDWKKENKILDDDSEEVKALKRRKNSMRIKKKPYYFIYIYDKLKKQYMQYRKNNDYVCQIKFGCKIQELIDKKDKTDDEIKFLTRYNYFSPVLNTSCIMNMLCKRVEELDFSLKYDRHPKKEFDYTCYMKNGIVNSNIYAQTENILKALVRNYNSVASRLREDGDEAKRFGVTLSGNCKNALKFLFEDAFRQIMEIVNNKSFMADYVIDIAYKKKSSSLLKTFVWTMFGKDILKNLGETKTHILVPVIDDTGGGEDIFGMNVKLQKVTNQPHEDKNEDYYESVDDDGFFTSFEELDSDLGEDDDGDFE